MQIYILDKEYNLLAAIDEQEDIVFNKRFNDVGYCALKVACDAEMLELLKAGHYIFRFDDDMICRIVKPQIDTNGEQGDYLTVDAEDMNNILAGRIVRWEVAYSGTVAGFIKRLIVENVINPKQSQRRIENFDFDDSNFAEFTKKINVPKGTATQDLLQLVVATCKTYSYGFRVSLDIETRRLVFRLIRGKNKATMDSDEYVEFSPNFANIISSHYAEDESNYKNVVYVGYKSADKDDENIYLLSLYEGQDEGKPEPQGEERREVYVDATGTSRSITVEVLEEIFGAVTKESQTIIDEESNNGKEIIWSRYWSNINGERIAVATSKQDIAEEGQDEPEEKIEVTDYTYFLLIREVGKNKLSEHIKTQAFDGEVDTIDTYEYKKDYDLGDIVKVANEYGIETAAQITEVTESENSDTPYTVEPRYEYLN